MNAYKDKSQVITMLHQVPQEGKDGAIQIAIANPRFQLLELVKSQYQPPVAEHLLEVGHKYILKGCTGCLLKIRR